MITGVASTVQLLQTHQGHVIGGQTWDAVLGSRAEVDSVKAAAGDKRNSLVAVGFGVPRVATVFLLPQSLPHVAHTGGETHLGHLRKSRQQLHSAKKNPDAHSTTYLSVSQVCISSKQDGDIVWCLRHPLHHHSQLFHPLLAVAFAALQVRRHQTQLLTFEIHLNEEQDLTTTSVQI